MNLKNVRPFYRHPRLLAKNISSFSFGKCLLQIKQNELFSLEALQLYQ